MGEFSDDDSPDSQKGLLLHASCVSFDGRAVLITGVSGCGKSGLALQLMALGASLVSDDQTEIALRDDFLIARAPVAIRGIIEARGLGILNAETVEQARVVLMIDMDRSETNRLPPARTTILLGHSVALLWQVEAPHFASAVLHLLRFGRYA